MNDDRKVDGTDLAIWGSESASTSRADLNGDGKVDGSDLAVWQQNYAPIGLDGDSLVTWPVLESTKGKGGGATPRVADTCPVGHQGLFEDKEFGGILHNGARMRHPVLGSFMQRDPLGYGDGTNLYQLLRSLPISGLDPKGLKRLAYTYRHQSVVAGAHSRAEANSFELMWLPLPIPVPLPSDRTVATLDDYALERETFTAAKNLLSHHGIDIAELPPPNGYFHPQVVTISEFEIRNYKVMKYTERQLDYFDIDWEEEWDWIGDIGIGADDVIVYVPGIVGLQGREIALAAHWEKYHVIAFSRKHFPRLGLHERGPILAHEILHHFLKNTINPGSGDPAHDTEGIMAPDAGRVVIAGFRTPSTELGRKTVCALKALGIEDADIEPHYRMDQRNK
jgi:RHS repeat-associated protein